jgi:hypothetical protein
MTLGFGRGSEGALWGWHAGLSLALEMGTHDIKECGGFSGRLEYYMHLINVTLARRPPSDANLPLTLIIALPTEQLHYI